MANRRQNNLPPNLPPAALPIEAAAAYCGCSESTVRRYGPSPRQLGPRTQVWRVRDLDRWIEDGYLPQDEAGPNNLERAARRRHEGGAGCTGSRSTSHGG